jgi:hypothetical protein
MEFVMAVRLASRSKVVAAGGLAALLATAMMVAEPLAQTAGPKFTDTFGENEIDMYCSGVVFNPNVISTDTTLKVIALDKCRIETRVALKEWKDKHSKPAGTNSTSDSKVCVLKEARRPLIDDENESAMFTVLQGVYSDLRKELEKKDDLKILRLFGLPKNKIAQDLNRGQAYTFIENAERNLNFNVKSWAALASNECFDCAITEKWNILKSAVNVVAYSWHLSELKGVPQYSVGVRPTDANNKLAMVWTRRLTSDQEKRIDTSSSRSGETTDITKETTGFVGRSTRFVLNGVTDQWVNSLPGNFISDLQRQICDLDYGDDAKSADAFNTPAPFFRIARKIQESINTQFLVGTFDTASNAEKQASLPRNMVRVSSDSLSRKCDNQDDPADNYELGA